MELAPGHFTPEHQFTPVPEKTPTARKQYIGESQDDDSSIQPSVGSRLTAAKP